MNTAAFKRPEGLWLLAAGCVLLLVLGWERYFFRRRGRTVADTRGALA